MKVQQRQGGLSAPTPPPETVEMRFSVDAALLRELGERLVGAQHIALAELVKNAYDADATRVTIEIQEKEDKILVCDDGHGMDESEVRNHFMRVGTTHKTTQKTSRRYGRALTGSKGVGRLSVQFLAEELDIATIPEEGEGLRGLVDWESASVQGDLTEVLVLFDRIVKVDGLPADSRHGTRLEMTGLKHVWDADAVRKLASAIWWLRPPFAATVQEKKSRGSTADPGFSVDFKSHSQDLVEGFKVHLNAIQEIWHARVRGVWELGKATYQLERPDGTVIRHEHRAADPKFAHLKSSEFDIRIYHFQYRQPKGIRIDQARDYLNEWGGVQILDAGFRLPYYGDSQNDWLALERDHSHRLTKSQLLPDELQFERGLNYLPTSSRLLGVVWVNTNGERQRAKSRRPKKFEPLTIQITRDRLVNNKAQDQLRSFVRYAIDWYAMDEARQVYEHNQRTKDVARPTESIQEVENLLNDHAKELPKTVATAIRQALKKAESRVRHREEQERSNAGLLASLATAGMATLAYRHEQSKILATVEEARTLLKRVSEGTEVSSDELERVSDLLALSMARAREIDKLFEFVASGENREIRERYRIRPLIEDTIRHLEFLAPGAVAVDLTQIPVDTRFPPGTLAEWHSLVQNIITNAYAAMLHTQKRQLKIAYRTTKASCALLFQDTGTGVNLETAEELFRPFVRKTKLSAAQTNRGYGGSGLGLTIVRMISSLCDCTAKFSVPEAGFSTSFELSWREK